MADLGQQFRIRVLPGVVGVDPVDGLGHQHDIRADLQRPLRGRRIRGEVGQPHTGAEDHHAPLLQVPPRPQRNVGFGDLTHRDGGLHPGGDAFLLQEVLQRKAVHDGAEHAHVVRPGAFHAALLQLRAAEEVATADDDGDLHATAHHLRDLAGHLGDDVGVQADRPAAEHLTAELEQYAGVFRPKFPRLVRRRLCAVGAGRFPHQAPRSSRAAGMRVPSRRRWGWRFHPASSPKLTIVGLAGPTRAPRGPRSSASARPPPRTPDGRRVGRCAAGGPGRCRAMRR